MLNGGDHVSHQAVGHVAGQALAHDHSEHGDRLGVGGHAVGRHDPALEPQLVGQGEHAEARVVRQPHADDGQVLPAGHDVETGEAVQLGGQPAGRLGQALHYFGVALAAQADEVVVLGHDLRRPPREVQAEVGVRPAQVVDLEDELAREVGLLPPDDPAHPGVDQAVLVPAHVDGPHARQAEVPQELGRQERRNETARRGVDVQGHVPSPPVLVAPATTAATGTAVMRIAQCGQRGIEGGDGLVLAGVGRAQYPDHADGVLVDQGHGLGHPDDEALGGQWHVAGLDVEVAGELLPAHLDVRSHDDVRAVKGEPGRLAGVAPTELHGQAGEVDGLGAPDGRRPDAVLVLAGAEEPAQHVHAAVLQGHRLGVLVPVDGVLVGRLGHEAVGLVVHVGGDEGGQVEGGIRIEGELVVDELVGGAGLHRLVGQDVARDGVGQAAGGVGGCDVERRLIQGDLAAEHGHGR